jgi:hypothetical protein
MPDNKEPSKERSRLGVSTPDKQPAVRNFYLEVADLVRVAPTVSFSTLKMHGLLNPEALLTLYAEFGTVTAKEIRAVTSAKSIARYRQVLRKTKKMWEVDGKFPARALSYNEFTQVLMMRDDCIPREIAQEVLGVCRATLNQYIGMAKIKKKKYSGLTIAEFRAVAMIAANSIPVSSLREELETEKDRISETLASFKMGRRKTITWQEYAKIRGIITGSNTGSNIFPWP